MEDPPLVRETDWSLKDIPGWLVVALGGVGAAVMGALVGGAMHI